MIRLLRRTAFPGCMAAALLGGHLAGAQPAAPHEARRPPDAASAALSGTVRSAPEGAMEGVLVIAQRAGSPVLTAVATDATGRYAFPRDHLRAGPYSIRIRAAGYELAGSRDQLEVKVPGTRDLALVPVSDQSRLASQLTNLEWLMSWPGSARQKDMLIRNLVNCGFCHSLGRIAGSQHTAEEFRAVIQRMGTYETDHSSAERIQIVSPPAPLQGLQWYGRDAAAIAEYLASVNLSGGKTRWDYPLQVLPRPRGKATRLIVTVYPIPRQPSVVHDLDVDSKGNVWYGNTGWDYLGRLDPRSGKFSEWPAPNYLPPAAAGVDRIQGVQDIQVDPDGRVWAAIGGTKLAAFAPARAQWTTYDVPVVWLNPFRAPVHRGQRGIWVTGLPTAPAPGTWPESAFHLDIASGTLSPGIPLYAGAPPVNDPDHTDPFHYCYMMDQDAAGNFVCTDAGGSTIARADLASGRVHLIPTPTARAFPRRGYRDEQNRFWFGEFYADKIGVLDLGTDSVREFDTGTPYISPYYARPDAHGNVWVSSTGSDRLLRLDPSTGEIVQYLMPVYYDARKVVVDRSAAVTTVWLPNKNTAQLVRVEVPD